MDQIDKLIPLHGGYRKLKSFQMAQLVFDITVRFCKTFIPIGSRTQDQMVQAARSGVQNIAEGSQASGTSKQTEIRLTNVARASLEELKLDYEDFLRQKNLKLWPYGDTRSQEFIDLRVNTADNFSLWAKQISKRDTIPVEEVAANGLLVLLNITCSFLNKQLLAQADFLQREGDFNERIYKTRRR